MIRAAALLLLLAAAPAGAETVLPSGLAVTAADVHVEPQPDGETWLVLRYLAPAIEAGAVGYEAVTGDLDHLCETEGLAAAEAAEAEIAQIVIVLMDRPVPRGEAVAEATQYIGAYLLEDGRCQWE